MQGLICAEGIDVPENGLYNNCRQGMDREEGGGDSSVD